MRIFPELKSARSIVSNRIGHAARHPKYDPFSYTPNHLPALDLATYLNLHYIPP